MGNCVFRAASQLNRSSADTIKVTTSNGGVMELFPPITADCITNEFPNHAIFTTTSNDVVDKKDNNLHPLLHTDELHLGHSYFLLPITNPVEATTSKHCSTPYRMSLHSHQWRWSSDGLDMMSSSSTTTSTPRCKGNGVWKVKLVINPEQLSEILAQEATTEELVESLRTVAKCGNGIGASGSITASDQLSISTGPNQFNENIFPD